jgi:signal transduction histidine kinase
VRLAPVAVDAVLRECARNFHERAQSRGVTLALDVAPDLPLIDADDQRLVQALSNLIGNAIKFTPPGGRIVLTARSGPEHVGISVRDTGCGIARENFGLIFDRFWQADRTAGGAGLGLAIVKGIVESHHGEIRVESEPGHGTTFFVRLPRAADATTFKPNTDAPARLVETD